MVVEGGVVRVEGVDVADAAFVLIGEDTVDTEEKELRDRFFFLEWSLIDIGQKLNVWIRIFRSLMEKFGVVLKMVMVDEGERATTSMAHAKTPKWQLQG